MGIFIKFNIYTNRKLSLKIKYRKFNNIKFIRINNHK